MESFCKYKVFIFWEGFFGWGELFLEVYSCFDVDKECS